MRDAAPPLLHRGLLKGVQMSVKPVGRYQVVVSAHLRDGSLLQHADHVGIPYGGQTMRYGDARPALHRLVQRRLHDLHRQKYHSVLTLRPLRLDSWLLKLKIYSRSLWFLFIPIATSDYNSHRARVVSENRNRMTTKEHGRGKQRV